MTIEQMQTVLRNGECVIYKNRIITTEAELPSATEIATTDPAQAQALLANMLRQQSQNDVVIKAVQAALAQQAVQAEADRGTDATGSTTPGAPTNPTPESGKIKSAIEIATQQEDGTVKIEGNEVKAVGFGEIEVQKDPDSLATQQENQQEGQPDGGNNPTTNDPAGRPSGAAKNNTPAK